MSDFKYISKREMDEIEKVNIDKDMLKRVKERSDNTFFKIQMAQILKEIKLDFSEDETIEFYCNGTNYSVSYMRNSLLRAVIFSRVCHPIYEWNTNDLLIVTNKRMIIAEADISFQYLNHYEIDPVLHLFKDEKKNCFYITVHGDNRDSIIQYNYERFDFIMDFLKSRAEIIQDEKLKFKPSKFEITASYIFPLLLLYFIIIMLIEYFKG